MILTIHRGTHQIGGSCVKICTDNSKILIDFGLPLDYDKYQPEKKAQIRSDAAQWCKDVDALFLSHAHTDHYGLFDLLADGTPIYASEETFAMLALDSIFGTDHTERFRKYPMRSYEPYTVCGLTVVAYPVDHSAYGASAFLFESERNRVLYSGDIRLHGVKGKLYKLLPQQVDYMLLEGTNIARMCKNHAERTIEEQFVETFNEAPNALHLVWCSSRNIDRICVIYRACKRCGKELLVEPYTANVLDKVARLNHKIPSVTTAEQMKVYFPSAITGKLKKRDKYRYIYSLQPKYNKVTSSQISALPGNFVMLVRPSVMEFLQNISVSQVRFVNSIWSGYWEEERVADFRKWVETHCERMLTIHSSGHADIESLQKIVDFVKPKCIVPIHTEVPNRFSELLPDCKVIQLSDGEVLDL